MTNATNTYDLPIDKLFALGSKLSEMGAVDQAVGVYKKILDTNKQHHEVFYNLISCLAKLRSFDEALMYCMEALSYYPENAMLLALYGHVLTKKGRYAEAIAVIEKSLSKQAYDFVTHYYAGQAYAFYGDTPKAIEHFQRSCELNPHYHSPKADIGVCLLRQGDYLKGWGYYEFRVLGMKSDYDPALRWIGEEMKNKRLLIVPEQGFGDMIWAMRFLPQVKALGIHVILQCDPALKRLFEHIPSIDTLVTTDNPETPAFDMWCSIMNLPAIFNAKPSDDNIPDLNIPDSSRTKIGALLSPHVNKLRVGIVWSGNPQFERNFDRSVSPELFRNFLSERVQLFSLQKGEMENQADAFFSKDELIRLGPHLDDFADTAAAIEALDLIIMTDSAVAHLAGSMHKPVWNLLDYVPFWLYGMQGRSTFWYPSMTLYRQPSLGQWQAVFDAAKSDLDKYTHGRH